jgi:KUP system potassium uptake protein
MIGLVALLVWQVPTYVVVPVWLIFAALDGLYLSSALTKVPQGAWFTLALAVVLSTMFILWRFGKEQQWHAEASDRFPPSHMLIADDTDDSKFGRGLKLSSAFGGSPITRINGIGIFFDKSGIPSTTPTVFVHFLQKFHAVSEVVIFFNLRPLETPTVPPEERFTITRCYIGSNGEGDSGSTRVPMKNCYRIIIRHGYNDQIVTNDLGILLYEQLRDFVIREGVNASISERKVILDGDVDEKYDSSGDLAEAKTQIFVTEANTGRGSFEQREVYKRLADLQKAFDNQVVYVVGKEQLRFKKKTSWPRRIILSAFLWVRDNTRTKVQALNIAVDKLVEVGFVKEV